MTASIPTLPAPVSPDPALSAQSPSAFEAAAPEARPGRAARASSGPSARARFVGIDIARLLAIVGMMATHLIATEAAVSSSGSVGAVAAEVTKLTAVGIAAPLFAVLGGVSAALASRVRLAEDRVGAAIAAVALRGAVIFFLGLPLGMLVSPVAVVLCYFGVAMILIAPFIAIRGPILSLIAVAVGAASGPVNALVRQSVGEVAEIGSPSFDSLFWQPIESLRALFITGIYPAMTWFVYLLAGVLLARALVTAARRGTLGRVSAMFAAGGIAVAVAGQAVSSWAISHLAFLGSTLPDHVDEAIVHALLESPGFGAPAGSGLWAQLIATPHTGSGMDLVRTIAISFAVICLLVLAFDASGKAHGRIVDVFRAAGAAPLTVYVLHVLAIALTIGFAFAGAGGDAAGLPWWMAGLGGFAIHVTAVILIGYVLSRTGRRGPLESLVSQGVENTVMLGSRVRGRM